MCRLMVKLSSSSEQHRCPPVIRKALQSSLVLSLISFLSPETFNGDVISYRKKVEESLPRNPLSGTEIDESKVM